jgi:choline dehydrogenase-like flavoprotein
VEDRLYTHELSDAWIAPADFSEPVDRELTKKGMRELPSIAGMEPLRRLIDKPYLPSQHELDDRTLDEHVRMHTQSEYDLSGTCAMGITEDSVVDPQLRVRSVESLRVVDASIMPLITRGNTDAPTIMIGERGAD